MFFHSLDYMLFLGLALLAFWGLRSHRRFGLPLVLLVTAVYFGLYAFGGVYVWPVMALIAIDLLPLRAGARAEGEAARPGIAERWRHFWARPYAARATLLFVISCAFYMAWQAHYIWLILASTCVDYFVGIGLSRMERAPYRRLVLAFSLTFNLGLLFVYKYYNFFALELSTLLDAPDALPLLQAALPVGISFYTFQTLSYTIDIYRRKLEPARDFVTFAAFVSFFPQLVAGPIVRASELLPQLQERPRITRNQVSDGLFLIATGLVKKLAIADYLALGIVDRVFVEPDKFTALEVVVALYAFTMQLYCDFSGYTDVARGSAKLMGFELPRNFDRPYQATNPAEFWRRWHMTLSRWLRDYLYFPLGGSRVGPVRAYWNLALTMFLVGIWHGSWTNFEVFFWYALLQAVAMVLHRLWRRNGHRLGAPKDASALPFWGRAALVFLSLQFVVFSRILFRAGAEVEPMTTASLLVERLRFGSWGTAIQVPWSMWTLLGVTFFLHFLPRRYFDFSQRSFQRVPVFWKGVLLAAVAFLLMEVGSREALPFQYFQF